MAQRTKKGQKIHDEAVARWASRLKGPGKQVLTDLPDRKKPPKIGGKTPDIVVKRGGKVKLIGEVETRATVKTDKLQQETFKKAAKKLGAEFKLKIAKEKRRR